MAWLTPLLAGILVAGALQIGLPGGLLNGPVSATAREGDFELTIRSDRARYDAGEPIGVSATLTYLGQGGQITLGHETGGEGRPIAFGVVEPVFPGYHLSGGVSRLGCQQTTIASRESIDEAFRKAGGGYGGDSSQFLAYMQDPVFWLSEGTWHPYALVSFMTEPGPGDCGTDVSLRVEIEIEVGPRPPDASSVPSTTNGPLAPKEGTERWKSSMTEGEFELVLEAAKEAFSGDETLDVTATLTYLGPDDAVVIGHGQWDPIDFSMKAPGVTLTRRGRFGCTELDLQRGVPITEQLLDLNGIPHPFRIAHGLHEVIAFAGFRLGGCNQAAEISLEAEIVLAVADGPDDIPLVTDVASEQTVCLLVRFGGQLVVSETGLGIVDPQGDVRQVVWPNGYSAHRVADGAVLVGRDARVIAHTGEQVLFDAIDRDDGLPIWPCGDVEVDSSLQP
jgi:hypothetical protein